jgi:predicted transcriptional regulator
LENADAQTVGAPQAHDRQGAMAILEIARRAERDVRAVHSDIHVLIRAGILEKPAEDGVLFPYDAIHVDFLLKAA